ncbi:hypothetical protein ACFYZ9_39155 [Streptomyces sp. NPDC001691]|uniref:hypothetical protein n=1 Tax=unclassified Streptomyces TaxID=2593676 RepID=UPI000DEB3D6B|nr:hypothetical protein [Streptomyces sp. SDr-06]RCH67488.1 hypothetical protein DT019_17945 [Streptomyces sp. SDr-06]
MTQTRTSTAYVTPECREARKLSWDKGHVHCPGPLEVRQTLGTVAVEVLQCACSCHTRMPGAPA